MSDLLSSNAPSGAAGSGRAQNGSARPAPGAAAAATGQARFRTPTVVMAERRAREAKRAEQEAQRKRQEEDIRRQQTENVVGVGDDRRQPGSARVPLTEIQPGAAPVSTGVTTSRRRTETIPASNGAAPRTAGTANPSTQQQIPDPTSTINKNRTEAFEKLSMPAVAGPKPAEPQPTSYPTTRTPAQPSGRPGFPHAFERWETLSSHWEGLTAYWIRKLQANTDELSSKPIDQQMARQITDLSAAGANLFHAVVELQRLRASSERKFQRWFFETRNEQEQAQERIAELERQIENGTTSGAAYEAMQAEKSKADELVREMRRELSISKEEARRAWEELGRREQEERERTIALRSGEPTLIGGVQVVPMAGLTSRHMSASSRPQTRGGPIPGGPGPTQMSGQQQQPQQQYESREAYSRSQTTLESPEREQSQFTYQRGQTSPTETDPFTETSRMNEPPQLLRHEPDTQFYSSQPRSQSQPGVAAATARTTASPARGQTQSTSPSRFYQGAPLPTYQPATTGGASYRPVTSSSDNRSYIPSTASGSEEEYHINPDGSYTRDAQGRRIPASQPIAGPGVEEEEDVEEEQEEEDDDEDDYTAEVERERMYAQQYSQRQAAISQSPRTTATAIPTTSSSGYLPVSAPTNLPQPSSGSRSYSSTISAASPPQTQPTPPMQPNYQSPSFSPASIPEDDEIPSNIVTGWEGIQAAPRHHHPSRLSAILEERSGRTSPSRTSYASDINPANQRGGGNNNSGAANR